MTFLQVDVATLATGVNLLWVLVVTFLIFFMHAGFAMLEAGQVRSKNVANQLTKNLLTWSVGVAVYFLVGAAVSAYVAAWTGPSTTGVAAAFSTLAPTSPNAWVGWLFGAVFAMTAATIVSGAVAGRMKLRAYVAYTVLLSAVIYPVVTGLTWGGGVLGQLGFHDFAGGVVVHAMGGVAGLTAAAVLGPRVDRFDDDGSANVIPGHSLTFAALGTLVLAFGWYGFNVGTAATVFDPAAAAEGTLELGAFAIVGRVAATTTLGMAAGAIGAGAASLYKTGKVDTLYVANGLLAGLVGVTSITDAIVWPGALVVGLLAGAQLPVVFKFVERRLRIDDVCAVFPVHGSAGILGALAFPFVSTAFWSGAGVGYLLETVATQAIGVLVIVAWTVAATGLVFVVARATGQIRVSREHELEGLDVTEHGVDTYPEFGRPDVTTDGGRLAGDGRDWTAEDGVVRADGGPPNGGGIKLVTAFVRPDKLADVKTALATVGAPSLTVTNVSGRGTQPAKTGQWRGEEYRVDLHQKVKVECVVADVPAADVAAAIRDAARTGEPGDGKVFVLPVEDAYQIRTGERGTTAV